MSLFIEEITSMMPKISQIAGVGGTLTEAVAGTVKITPVAEDDSRCTSTGVTDAGIQKSARWKTMLSASMLALNTANSLRMAKLQRDLGEKYLQLSEDHKKYYEDKYRGLEQSLVEEASKLPKYVRDKEQTTTGQMMISARIRFAGKADKALSCTGRYCTGQRAAIILDQLMQEATAESMVAGLAHRYIDKEEINHNNQRWEKREQVLKIGRDIPTSAVAHASLAANIFGAIGKQAGEGAEGAISFLAYKRADTQYPPARSPISVSGYTYKATPLQTFEPKPKTVYKQPEAPKQSISIRG